MSQPAVVFGLTLLAIGLTFALPFTLVPRASLTALSHNLSPEVVNVYACVAWAGWAHFVFAFAGQGRALASRRDARLPVYVLLIGATVAVLLALRWISGPEFFGAVVWVYFIDHFIKAERSFEGTSRPTESFIVRWLASYQPLLTFSWLSLVLFDVGGLTARPWLLWIVSLALGAVVLVFGGWRKLSQGQARGPLISMFFVAEALVWGTFSQYGGPVFLAGVYIFHIAAGSYFHYFGSYFFARAKAFSRSWLLSTVAILAINAAMILVGFLSARSESLAWLTPVFGIEWFTLWVALHLVSSDIFPVVKAWNPRPAA